MLYCMSRTEVIDPMERIEGRTALVTGAASGIGRSIATALLDAGARVVLTDSGDAALRRACARLGDSARPHQPDVADRPGWERARRFAEGTFGPVGILVNNARRRPDWLRVAAMAVAAFPPPVW